MKIVDTTEIVEVVQKYSPYAKFLSKKYFIKGGTTDDLLKKVLSEYLRLAKAVKGESLFDSGFEAFVKMCIKRQMLDAIRKSNAQKNKVLNKYISYTNFYENGDERSILDIALDRNLSNDPLDIFIDKEKVQEKLRICESELNDFEKEVLTHYLSGEKQSEIARSINKDVKLIDNTLQRIKNKLNKK